MALNLEKLNQPTMGDEPPISSTFVKRNVFIKSYHFIIQSGSAISKLLTKQNTYVELICALLLILFLYTGMSKLLDITKFKFEMRRSPFIQPLADLIAYALPVGEILLSALLIIRRTRLLGLYISFGLMALFTGYIWLMLNYAYDLPCSCGGIISKLSWNQHLVFNSIFTFLCIVGVMLETKIKQSNTRDNCSNKQLSSRH